KATRQVEAGRPAAKRGRRPKRARPARGQIGPQTYEQVRKLVETKGIPVGQACAEVAKATGRKAGTVAVTYYRVARQKGGTGRRGRPRAGMARRGRPPRGALTGVRSVLSRVTAAIEELEGIIAHQAREIERLASESKLAARIRKALRE